MEGVGAPNKNDNKNDVGAPNKNDVGAPAPNKNDVGAPNKNDVGAPAPNKNDAKNDVGAPNKNDVGAPNKNDVGAPNKNDVDKFDRLVKKNKASGKHWYHGLEGRWWWGMTEEQVRQKIESRKVPNRHKIAITSIIRNEEHSGNLKTFLDCCEKLEQYHKDIVYIFIEGDSSDDTYEILQEWLRPRKDYILKK